MRTVRLRHNQVELALHELRAGEGRTLLHLHGLGERSPTAVPAYLDGWDGPVHALDFTGHGASTVPNGGGYTAEVLMADVDCALRHIGPATLFGRGLGAYVALLAAGARPDLVRGVVLCDGPGISGAGTEPGSTHVLRIADADGPVVPDPYALAELARDIRPPDYASDFVRLVVAGAGSEHPIAVVAVNRPPWLSAVVAQPGVVTASLAEALAFYA